MAPSSVGFVPLEEEGVASGEGALPVNAFLAFWSNSCHLFLIESYEGSANFHTDHNIPAGHNSHLVKEEEEGGGRGGKPDTDDDCVLHRVPPLVLFESCSFHCQGDQVLLLFFRDVRKGSETL